MQLGGLTFPTANIVTAISQPNLYFGTLELSVGSMGQQGQNPCVTTISVPPWPQYMMRKPITSWYHSLLRALFKIQEIGLEAFTLRVLKSGLGMTLHPSIISILQGGMANQIIMQYFWNFIGLYLFPLLHLESLIDTLIEFKIMKQVGGLMRIIIIIKDTFANIEASKYI